MPNVLLEGLASKIPIISTNCQSGPDEILENNKYGSLIKVNDVDELSKKILEIMQNYELAKLKAEEGSIVTLYDLIMVVDNGKISLGKSLNVHFSVLIIILFV